MRVSSGIQGINWPCERGYYAEPTSNTHTHLAVPL